MQAPPNLVPTAHLTLNQQTLLIDALKQGGMPSLFFPGILATVETILAEAIRADQLIRQGDPFARGCRL